MAAPYTNADSATVQPLAPDQTPLGSMNMDDLLNDIYSDAAGDAPAATKTADEVWKEIVVGQEPEMTLEVFLTKAGAVAPDDVEIPAAALPPPPPQFQGYAIEMGEFGNGIKRRKAEEEAAAAVDKMTQQRQRRMIKNRESAARSRERKQAYTVELEALVMQLEEENARLVREEAQRSSKRYKKLMENLIPVGENQRPPMRAHRRVHSVG